MPTKTVDVDGSMSPILSRQPLIMSEKVDAESSDAAMPRALLRAIMRAECDGSEGSCTVAWISQSSGFPHITISM